MHRTRLATLVLSLGMLIAVGVTGVATAERPSPPGTLTLTIAVCDTDAFLDEWVYSPSSHAPVIRVVHEVGREKSIYAAFIVSGHLHDCAGLSRVDVDFVVRRPDGRVDNAERAFATLHGRECTARNAFAMADPALTYVFTAEDPAGSWQIEATAHDRLNGKSVRSVYPITLKP